MSFLTKEEILGADDIVIEVVSCPEWGGDVRVKSISAADRDAFEAMLTDGGKNKGGMANFRAQLCAKAIVGEDGRRMFSGPEITALGQKSARALSRVFDVALRLSGTTASDVEELAGNSDDPPPDDSSSG